MDKPANRLIYRILLSLCSLFTIRLLLHGTALQAGVMFAVTTLLYLWQGGVFSRLLGQAPASVSSVVGLTLHPDTLSLNYSTGQSETLPLEQLRAVRILTNDSGPFGNDLYFVLEGEWGTRRIPGDLDDCQQLFGLFDRLSNFDHEKSVQAMCSTANAVFDVWHAPQQGAII